MRTSLLFPVMFLSFLSCHSQEKTSPKKFDDIVLLNRIDFVDTIFNQARFSCAFLLNYKGTVYAVTAKHLLQIIRPPDMKTLLFNGKIRQWSFFPMDKKNETVIAGKLLNENPSQSLTDKTSYLNDWLVFSITENRSTVKALQYRASPLIEGEKLYVAGWTRKMETGPQRIYEFTYYKTIANRILLQEFIVPEQFGGLSGAPLVDKDGRVVGLVSNGTVDPVTGKKYFSPCSLQELLVFLDKY